MYIFFLNWNFIKAKRGAKLRQFQKFLEQEKISILRYLLNIKTYLSFSELLNFNNTKLTYGASSPETFNLMHPKKIPNFKKVPGLSQVSNKSI